MGWFSGIFKVLKKALPVIQIVNPYLKMAALVAGTAAAVAAFQTQRRAGAAAQAAEAVKREELKLLSNINVSNRRLMAPEGQQPFSGDTKEIERKAVIAHLGFDPFEYYNSKKEVNYDSESQKS